jgi:hypothetical protein
MADETHHRDVNHTFADMKSDDANPFVINHKGNPLHSLCCESWYLNRSIYITRNIWLTHIDDIAYALKLQKTGEKAWSEETSPAPGAAGNSKPVFKDHFTHH